MEFTFLARKGSKARGGWSLVKELASATNAYNKNKYKNMLKLYRNNNGKFITAYAYREEEKICRLALAIFLSIGVVMSIIDAVI